MCITNEEVLAYEANGCHVHDCQHMGLLVFTVKEGSIIGCNLKTASQSKKKSLTLITTCLYRLFKFSMQSNVEGYLTIKKHAVLDIICAWCMYVCISTTLGYCTVFPYYNFVTCA